MYWGPEIKTKVERNISVSFIGREITTEGKHRGLFLQSRTCFHSNVFVQLLETCLEQGKALGSDPSYLSLLLEEMEGEI